MGANWDAFKKRIAEKSVDVGMIIIDAMFLAAIAGALILLDDGREWLSNRLGMGNLFTQVTLVILEVLVDLCAVLAICRWLKEEIERVIE